MRVVLDTNVFISAALKQDSVPALVVLGAEKSHVVLKSIPTERQLFDVLARPYFAPLIDVKARAWLRGIMAGAELVGIVKRIAACRDRTDDKFLELAVSGRADVIVSGDADLLDLHPFRGVPIVMPAEFLHSVNR